MTITQTKFNFIIDLLGDYIFALRFNLEKPLLPVQVVDSNDKYESYLYPNDADLSISEVEAAKNAYYGALSKLYGDEIPSVFAKPFRVFKHRWQSNNGSHWWGYESIEKAHMVIGIDEIMMQLNADFNLSENNNGSNALGYTGTRYKSNREEGIFIGAKKSINAPGNMLKTNFYFVITALSDPIVLMLAVLSIPVSGVLFGIGAIIPAAIIAAASISIACCYAAKKLGFFAENNGTQTFTTIEPYAFDYANA